MASLLQVNMSEELILCLLKAVPLSYLTFEFLISKHQKN
jgi:hypothetical protein